MSTGPIYPPNPDLPGPPPPLPLPPVCQGCQCLCQGSCEMCGGALGYPALGKGPCPRCPNGGAIA